MVCNKSGMWATGARGDASPCRTVLPVFVQTSCPSLSDPLGIKTLCGGTVLHPTENILTTAPFMKKGMRFEMAETGKSR